MAKNVANPDPMIRRLAPALIFAMSVTGTFAALAAAHAFGTPAVEPGRLGPRVVAGRTRDPLPDSGRPRTARGTLELVALPREVVRQGDVTNLLLRQGIHLPSHRRFRFDELGGKK